MAQAGFTPISLYYSATAAAVPLAANLVAGELALNTVDGKLYYKSLAGVVTLLAGATAGPAGGSNTQVQFNSSGALAGSANLTWSGTTLAVTGTLTTTGTAATNTTAFTAGSTTTGFNRGRISNTGGDLRFGIDSSVGAEAVAGSAAYSSFIGSFTNTPFYLVSNSAIVGTVSSTGLAVTGTLSNTGLFTNFTNTAKTSGTLVSFRLAQTNEAVNYGALQGSFVGAAAAANRLWSLQTVDQGLANAGILSLQPDGGTLLASGLTVGRGAGFINGNTVLGNLALAGSNVGVGLTAVGYTALATNTGGTYNSAFGFQALVGNLTGANNTALGTDTLVSNQGGNNNTAVGYQAGYTNVSGSNNFYGGFQTGYHQTASSNTAIGFGAYIGTALQANNGAGNTAFGNAALQVNYSGSFNVAVGGSALIANTTASNNTAVGYEAGASTNAGSGNVFLGYRAGYLNQAGNDNTFVGNNAGYGGGQPNYGNVAVGIGAGGLLGAGANYNTFIGVGAGAAVTSGAGNTVVGGFSGQQNGVDIRTASGRIAIADGAGSVRYYHDGSASAIVYPNIVPSPTIFYVWDTARFYPNPDNSLNLGLGSNRFNTVYASNGTINTSDENEKQDIRELSALELAVAQEIKGLFKTYRWKSAVAEKGDAARIHVGVIAQDVKEAFAKHGLDASRYALWCSDTWFEVDGKASPIAAEPFTAETPNAVPKTRLGIRYDQLLAFVISAL
jgi:hypothetical protein